MQLYEKYVTETVDEKTGRLTKIDFHIPDDFNFGFDVVDFWGKNTPDKTALLWVGEHHEEKTFTFSDMMRLTNKTANYFRSLGIKKGDRIMLILRRHYQFWFSIVALHKIGAIVIPATDQLMKKDLVYRFNLAGVSAVVISSTGSIVDEAEKPLSNATSKRKYLSGQAVTAGTISMRNFRRFRTSSSVAKALTQLIKTTPLLCSLRRARRVIRNLSCTITHTQSDTLSLPNGGIISTETAFI